MDEVQFLFNDTWELEKYIKPNGNGEIPNGKPKAVALQSFDKHAVSFERKVDSCTPPQRH